MQWNDINTVCPLHFGKTSYMQISRGSTYAVLRCAITSNCLFCYLLLSFYIFYHQFQSIVSTCNIFVGITSNCIEKLGYLKKLAEFKNYYSSFNHLPLKLFLSFIILALWIFNLILGINCISCSNAHLVLYIFLENLFNHLIRNLKPRVQMSGL